jgi:type VI secretion system protein ImpF
MPEPTPVERLQPCLLDRLTDDEPDKKEESRTQRVVSHQKYRRGVLRDLEWLLNASACLDGAERDRFRPEDYPEAFRSVLNFGTKQLTGQTSPNLEALKDELAEAVAVFEPRIAARSLSIRANADRNYVVFDVEGELWANPLPEHLHVKTTLDFETGQCMLGDATNG